MSLENYVVLAKHTMEVERHHPYATAFGVLMIVGMIVVIGLLVKICRDLKHKR